MSEAAYLTADAILFPVLQIGLVLFAIVSAFVSWWSYSRRKRRTRAVLSAVIKRGPVSMGYFYGAYVALTGVFVALCLEVEFARYHRVLFVLLDTILVAYVCLFNAWFRNKLVGWINQVATIEHR